MVLYSNEELSVIMSEPKTLKISSTEDLKKIMMLTAHVTFPRLANKSLREKIDGLHFSYEPISENKPEISSPNSPSFSIFRKN